VPDGAAGGVEGIEKGWGQRSMKKAALVLALVVASGCDEITSTSSRRRPLRWWGRLRLKKA